MSWKCKLQDLFRDPDKNATGQNATILVDNRFDGNRMGRTYKSRLTRLKLNWIYEEKKKFLTTQNTPLTQKKGRKETYTLSLYLPFMQILLRWSKMLISQIWPVYNFECWDVFIFIHHRCIHCDIQSLLEINVTFNVSGILSRPWSCFRLISIFIRTLKNGQMLPQF